MYATENKLENIEKTQWGFFQFKDKPTNEELTKYYRDKYFESNEHNYKTDYCIEEIRHKTFVNSLILHKAVSLISGVGHLAAYDIGCGEGFMVNEMYKRNFDVKSCDFSNTIEKYFPQYAKSHKQGDIYEIIENDFQKEKFDIITVMNVLEHALDPVALIKILKSGLKENSILAITVPEDFSELQNFLLDKKQTAMRWIAYPDHISYFNHKSIKNFLNDFGLTIVTSLASFPIEIFLLNDILNYDKDKSKGKDVYSIIRDFDLYLSTLDIEKVIKLYESFADLGLGRNITYFCKLN